MAYKPKRASSGRKSNAAHPVRELLATLPVVAVFLAVTVIAWILPLRPTQSYDEKRALEKFPDFSLEELSTGKYFRNIGLWFSDTFTFREEWLKVSMQVEDLYGYSDVVFYGDEVAEDDIPDISLAKPIEPDPDPEPEMTEPEPAATEPESSTEPEPEVTEPGNAETDSEPSTEPEPASTSGEGTETGTDTEPGTEPEGENDGETAAPESETGTEGEATGESDTDEPFDPTAEGATEEAPEDPTVTPWGGETIGTDEFVSMGRIVQIGDTGYGYTAFNKSACETFAKSINKLASKLPEDKRIFLVIAPKSTTFMLSREDREKMGIKPEEDAIAYMYSLMAERVYGVSVVDTMIAHNSEYIAFRTDHHWTQLGTYYAYTKWCEDAGFEPCDISDWDTIEYPGYLGTYYSRANKSSLMAKNPDTVVCYIPKGNIQLYLSDNSGDGLGWEQTLITNRSNASSGGKYLAFLAGDHAKGTFINNDITDGSACLCIKTSIGNPFVYFLTQHYQYVYVIDARYYSNRSIRSFADKFNVQDVIFMFGAEMAMGSGGNQLIANLCR